MFNFSRPSWRITHNIFTRHLSHSSQFALGGHATPNATGSKQSHVHKQSHIQAVTRPSSHHAIQAVTRSKQLHVTGPWTGTPPPWPPPTSPHAARVRPSISPPVLPAPPSLPAPLGADASNLIAWPQARDVAAGMAYARHMHGMLMPKHMHGMLRPTSRRRRCLRAPGRIRATR